MKRNGDRGKSVKTKKGIRQSQRKIGIRITVEKMKREMSVESIDLRGLTVEIVERLGNREIQGIPFEMISK